MRTKLVAASTLLIAGLALTGCGSSSGSASSMAPHSSAMSTSASSPAGTSTSAMESSGAFEGLNGKKVAGTATVAGAMVKLSGFSSAQGPDLHLSRTNGTDESAVTAGKELGPVAYDQASQTFAIPAGIDISTFNHVVVHCDKAKAVFGAASLS